MSLVNLQNSWKCTFSHSLYVLCIKSPLPPLRHTAKDELDTLHVIDRPAVELVLRRQPEARAAEECAARADGERGPAVHDGPGPERERRRGLLQRHGVSQVNSSLVT